MFVALYEDSSSQVSREVIMLDSIMLWFEALTDKQVEQGNATEFGNLSFEL